MVLLRGGRFLSSSDDPWVYPSDGERPVREVSVDSIWVDRFAVCARGSPAPLTPSTSSPARLDRS
jgi:formylglycine-generating enzyme required for sulfatase activity